MSNASPGKGSTIVLCKWQPELYEHLRQLADRLYVVLDEFDTKFMKPDWAALAAADRVYRISNFNSLEELGTVAADLLGRGVAIDRVVSFTEFSQFGAGYLDLVLRPGAADPTDHVGIRDKRLMKEKVTRAGVRAARFRSISHPVDPDEIADIASDLTFPVVLKPAVGFSTMNTSRVETPADLLDAVQGTSVAPEIRSPQLMVEEFVAGKELHVDSLWLDGDEQMFLVSTYEQPRLSVIERWRAGERSLMVDGSSVVAEDEAPELYQQAREIQRAVNAALGITNGASHMEVFETADGTLVFSEVATRYPGAWGPDLLSQYFGSSVWEALARVMTGHPVERRARSHRSYASFDLKAPRPGRITAVPSDQEIAAVEGVVKWTRIRSAGDVVTFNHPSEWCIFVTVGADSQEELANTLVRVRKSLRIDVAEQPAVSV
ncbi:ATP-grasp domain-containing protein [Streptomyces sp. NPDC057062]|uniref:ATP-grasp domain-containing protein n=1 Tax=Streptomyces sp. NPDC057062 TaxID=3346011 RepID=UPI00362EBD9A